MTICLGFSVIGNVAPDTVKPVPMIEGAVIVSGAVPVDVTITGSVAVDPTLTVPKLRLFGLTVTCGLVRAMPVLVNLIAVLSCLSALLLMVSIPLAVLASTGAVVTSSVTVCLGFRVIGNVAPDTVNSALLIVVELIVNGAVPVDVTLIVNIAVDPTVTLPKLRVFGLTVTCGLPRATPVLVTVIVIDGFAEELLLTVKVPVIAPILRPAACT